MLQQLLAKVITLTSYNKDYTHIIPIDLRKNK